MPDRDAVGLIAALILALLAMGVVIALFQGLARL